MSQLGMHMPGGSMQRRPQMNVYTGLLFATMVALAAACVFVWMQASKVGKNGSPWELQEVNKISFPGSPPGKGG